LYDNDLDASLVFTVLFLSSIVSLLFLLAWLEQPVSERWRPDWWVRWRQAPKHRTTRVGRVPTRTPILDNTISPSRTRK
jgi:hypothetical protein